MSDIDERGTPWIFWPFVAVWRLLTMILALTGRIICAVLGLVFMAIGVTVSLSIVGAPLGIPLAAFGMLLLVRSLF
jgi:hypothetical protein